MKRRKMRIQINLDQLNLPHLSAKLTVKVATLKSKVQSWRTLKQITHRQEPSCKHRLVSSETRLTVDSRCIKIAISWLHLAARELQPSSKRAPTKIRQLVKTSSYRGLTALRIARTWPSKIKILTLQEGATVNREARIIAKWSQQASKLRSNESKCTVRKARKRICKTWTLRWIRNKSLQQPRIRAFYCRVIIQVRAPGTEYKEGTSQETSDRVGHSSSRMLTIRQT